MMDKRNAINAAMAAIIGAPLDLGSTCKKTHVRIDPENKGFRARNQFQQSHPWKANNASFPLIFHAVAV